MARTTFSGPVVSDGGFETSNDLTVSGNVDLQGTANIFILPDSDPGVAGAIWNNSGNIDISAG